MLHYCPAHGLAAQRLSSRTGYGRPTPYHEDSEYWWQHGKGRVTKEGLAHIVTLWVAIDSSHRENGCMRVLRGSHVSGAAGFSEYETLAEMAPSAGRSWISMKVR